MKPILAGLLAVALIPACVNEVPQRQTAVERFYWDAMARAGREHGTPGRINLEGLEVRNGGLPGRPMINDPGRGTRSGGRVYGDSSTVLVCDADLTVKEAVEVVVSPRVSGSFEDPANPTPEFLAERREAARKALATSGYLSVRRGFIDRSHEKPEPLPAPQPAVPTN